jgi:hypothetical protein
MLNVENYPTFWQTDNFQHLMRLSPESQSCTCISLFKGAAQITLVLSTKYLQPETSTNINHSQMKPPPDPTTLNVMISCSNFFICSYEQNANLI